MKVTKRGKNTLATIGGLLVGAATALAGIDWSDGFTQHNIIMGMLALASFLGGFMTTFKHAEK